MEINCEPRCALRAHSKQVLVVHCKTTAVLVLAAGRLREEKGKRSRASSNTGKAVLQGLPADLTHGDWAAGSVSHAC